MVGLDRVRDPVVVRVAGRIGGLQHVDQVGLAGGQGLAVVLANTGATA